ncbi:MAG: TIR domain-containing protein [Candidatus Bathyarchaeia archaeon]
MVDTGASMTLLSHNDALALGLEYDELSEMNAATYAMGGRLPLHEIQDVRLALATEDGLVYRIRLKRLAVMPPIAHMVPSLLGMDVLRRFVIDFSHSKLYSTLKLFPKLIPSAKRRCFLSHNKADKAFVRRLATDLRKKKIEVWFDEWKIKPGDSISVSIEDALSKFHNFVLVMTPNSMKSRWVTRELSIALYRHHSSKGRQMKIIPLLRMNCRIPLWLRDIKYIDFRRQYRVAFRQLADALS